MSELDRVRQRITDKKAALPKNLELVKGPVLDMEAGLLKTVAETITPLLQAAKSEIKDKEGFAVGEQITFQFMYNNSGSGFDHLVFSDEDGKQGEVWKQVEKKLVKAEPEDNADSDYINKWVIEEGLPEKLVEGALTDGNWIDKNVWLFSVRLSLYNNEHGCHLGVRIYIPKISSTDPSSLKVIMEGPYDSDIDYPTRKHNAREMDLLAEDLVDVLDNKNYLKKKTDQN